MSDFGALKKLVNSNITGDPVNCLMYINSIESEGDKSYILHEDNSNLWTDLLMNSLTVYKIKSIHSIIYNRLTTGDVDTLIESNGRLGQVFNLFYDVDSFPDGGIDEIVTSLSTIDITILEKKFYNGIDRYIKALYASEDLIQYISEKFEIPEITTYSSIEEFAAVKEIVNKVYQNADLVEFLKYTSDFMKPIAASAELSEDLINNSDMFNIVESCDVWFHEFMENRVGLGKLLALKSGMNPTEYADINAIIDKTSAINSVVGNVEALSYVEKSDLGTAKIIAWKLEENALTVNSMKDLIKYDSMVSRIVGSNGAANDVNPILKKSIPSLKIGLTNTKISDLMIKTLGVDTPEVGYACIALYPDTDLFKTYNTLYEKVFTNTTLLTMMMPKKEMVDKLMENGAFLSKALQYEQFLTAFVSSKDAIHELEGYESVKKTLLENDAFSKKIVENDTSFSHISNRIGWASYIAYSYPVMNNIVSDYTKIAVLMKKSEWRSILLTSWMSLDIIMNSKNAIKSLKENITDSESFLDILISSETLMKYLTNMTSIFGSDTIVSELSSNNTLLKVITNSTSAMSSIIDSATGMVSVSDSESAMHAIANSKVLVRAILASDTALKAILYSETAMAQIAASNLAMKIITSNELGMEKVAASSVAMNAVAASSVARNACLASTTAMNAIYASDVAIAKFSVGCAGLSPADYANMSTVAASSVAMNAVAASSVAIGAIASSTTAKNAILASTTALNALDRSPLAKTMSSAGTVNGKGFVISYSVQSGHNTNCNGGYVVTIDSTVASVNAVDANGSASNKTASVSHKFFTSKIGLAFTTGAWTSYSATGSGSMKYILGK